MNQDPFQDQSPPAGRFAGRIALVTGGGRGVGAACARELAREGADVALLDAPEGLRTPAYPLTSNAELAALAAEIRGLGRRCLPLAVDVRDHEAVAAAVTQVVADLGGLDLIVVAAGIRTIATADELGDEAWDETVDVNLHGTYHVLRQAVPGMGDRGFGRVVVVTGDEARRGAPALSHYAAAGWAQIGLAKSVALETADAGVAVNVVCTTTLDTTMLATPDAWAREAGEPGADRAAAEHALRVRHPYSQAYADVDTVVDAALFLLGQPGVQLTGSVLDVSNGLSALNSC